MDLALALASFVLTILGTFMTRSGVFNSVHSFTQSDIGPTFLVFIAHHAGVLASCCWPCAGTCWWPRASIKSLVSRETAILVNNLVFVAITFTVLLGTLYPLVSEAVRGVRVSVGEPYFNKMAVPGGIAVLFLMGVGPMLPWGTPDKDALGGSSLPRRRGPGGGGGLLRASGCAASTRCSPSGSPASSPSSPCASWWRPIRVRMSERKEGLVTAWCRACPRRAGASAATSCTWASS